MDEGARELRAQAAAFGDLEGLWRSQGHGVFLEIGRAGYTLYEATRTSCMPVYGGTLEELARYYADLRVSPQGHAFRARRASGVTDWRFLRHKALPPRVDPGPGEVRDPVRAFEVFWHTFEENYALFELKGTDWEAVRRRYAPRVASDMPPEDLFATLCAMTQPLRDAHIHIRSSAGRFDAGPPTELSRRIARELEATDDDRDVASYMTELDRAARHRIRHDYLQGTVGRTGHGALTWGRLDEATGYLAVDAMAGLCGRVGAPGEDARALDEAMGRVLADLGGLPRLVLDVRRNGGGYDVVALRLASCFLEKRTLAFTKSVRHAAGFSPRQPVRVKPHPRHRYRGELVLLTSELTASAAEILVLALLQHPAITRVGERTRGILSDTMERHLPNGWFVTLSNELYRAYDDEVYEDRGIPPDERVLFLDRAAREADLDAALDHVLG